MKRENKEIWETVPSEPRYLVSNFGQAIGPRGIILRGALQTTGYLDITVDSRGRSLGKLPRRRSLAAMILEAFRGARPTPKHQVRHLNDIKTDNHLSNLAWGTAKQNSQDKCRNGRTYKPKGILHPAAKLTEKQVHDLRRVYRRYGREHIALAKRFGITGGTARGICRRKGWAHV